MVPAMILCAGRGTRLRPLTDELPKPLLPVGDRAQLCHVYDRLLRFGATPIVANTHHLAAHFTARLAMRGPGIHWVREPELRGTAGGIAGARELLGSGPVLVWNGDILADPPLDVLVSRASRFLAALAIAPRPRGAGTVGIGKHGRVVRLRGRSFDSEEMGGDYIGVAALSQQAVRELPSSGCLFGDYMLERLERGGSVAAVLHRGPWRDIGTPSEYWEANLAWLGGLTMWAATDARVSPDVTLRRSLIGRAARVSGSGLMDRVVVWPGAVAEAPLQDAIVTRSAKVLLAADPLVAESGFTEG